ncbi:diguanylate cyclase [Geothrix sp. 21YS21S-4]|uniref:diguanylate cyclase n=1 Tax=Geothrix sp. 21YS21S-4 TaxID=3068889 RepID=UPI0027BA1D0F|nr:diguanylate cyclase [Geothrix sp. 21YS21S-4]
MFNSLRLRLTIFFGGLSVLMGLALAQYVSRVASERMTAASGDKLHGVTKAIAHALSENLQEREREILLLSQSPQFIRGSLDSADIRNGLDQTKRSYRHYAWLGVTDARGRIVSAADGVLEGVDASARPWVTHGRLGAHVGDVHEAALLAKSLKAPNPNEPLRFVDFAAPVLDAQGTFRGVLGAHAHFDWVNEVFQKSLPAEAPQEGIESMVLNAKGEIIYPFQAIGRPVPGDRLPQPDSYLVLAWGDGGRFLTTTIAVKGPVNDLGWRVVLRQPISKALAPVAELHRNILLLEALATVVFMLLAYKVAGSFSRPVEELARVARRIEQGDERHPFSVRSGIRELADLIDSVRGMTTTLISRKLELADANATLERKVEARTAELNRANAALVQKAHEVADLYDNAPVGYHSLDAQGRFVHMNERELGWLGYEAQEVVERMSMADLLPPEEYLSFSESFRRLQGTGLFQSSDFNLVRKDGTQIPVRLAASALFDEEHQFVKSRAVVMDVTELRELEKRLRSQQILNHSIIHSSSNGLLLYREDGQCVLANEAAADIAGASVEELLAQNFLEIAHWAASGLRDAVLAAFQGTRGQLLIHSTSSFGKRLDSVVTILPLDHEGVRMVLLVVKDVSELMDANRELDKLARNDALTGLRNRLAANERLRSEFLRMKRSGSAYSVLLIDIDHFKRVNDTYGHETGDHVLQQVAECLRSAVRESDFVARFGGEEFLILLPDTTMEGALLAAEKVRAIVAGAEVPLVGRLTISVGLALADAEQPTEDAAVRLADQGLYRAKAEGRNRVGVA